MATGTLTPRGRRITVDFDPDLAAAIDSAADNRSTIYRRATASDIIREAVARFLLPGDGTDGSHTSTDTTNAHGDSGKFASEDSQPHG